MSYRTLEKDYYKVLHTLATHLSPKANSASKKELPYILESSTSNRLKPNFHWILSSISGAGKTTIARQPILAKFKKLPHVTTRTRRLEEKSNEYICVSNSAFLLWKRKNLLFHPHKRNGVWQAILKKDLKKLTANNSLIYLDKSVSSSIFLQKSLADKTSFTFLYILSPSFKELFRRINKRESLRKKGEKRLTRKEILKRFGEEIIDMKKTKKLPYAYVVNDSLARIEKVLKEKISKSKVIR